MSHGYMSTNESTEMQNAWSNVLTKMHQATFWSPAHLCVLG